MKYLGWAKPSDCIDFNAWLYWDIDYPYLCGTFYRIFGFEFIVKY